MTLAAALFDGVCRLVGALLALCCRLGNKLQDLGSRSLLSVLQNDVPQDVRSFPEPGQFLKLHGLILWV